MPVRDATGALVRAIGVYFADDIVDFVYFHSRDWVSGTLSATRHRIELLVSGVQAPASVSAFLAGIGEREFDLGRFILADITANCASEDGDALRLIVEALTIDGD